MCNETVQMLDFLPGTVYNKGMKNELTCFPTAALLDIGEDLNLNGRTDGDWTLLERIVAELRGRTDLGDAPYWLFG
jgi:hypothetical protein